MDKAGSLDDNFWQDKNDYKSGNIFFTVFFLVTKIKHCLTISEFGVIDKQKTFKGFNGSKRLLDYSQ